MKTRNFNLSLSNFGFMAFLVLIVLPGMLFGWGPSGHKIVARIAEANLTAKTKKAILDEDLLDVNSGCANKKTLADKLACVANWADDVRYEDAEFPRTYNWHFVDISLNNTTYEFNRDCIDDTEPEKGVCALLALDNLSKFLKGTVKKFKVGTWKPSASEFERGHALLFIVHMIGDIHQPLHTVKEQTGGNFLKVTYFKFACEEFANNVCKKDDQPSLHKVWDSKILSSILNKADKDEEEFAELLNDQISSQQKTEFEKNRPEDWLVETHRIAINNAYVLPTPKVKEADGKFYNKLTKKYVDDNSPIVEQQLKRAGIRLAKILNDIFAS